MARIEIAVIPLLADNYAWLVHEPAGVATAVIDPGEAEPVFAALAARGWRLTHILVTHHHGDHIGGIPRLKQETGARVFGARKDRGAIPGLDEEVGEGDSFAVGAAAAMVLEVPGHTLGHVAYYLPDGPALFAGDTLFSLGCGRLFEGTPANMWASLARLRTLPPRTLVCAAHEYTEANARFARLVERTNSRLARRIDEVKALRARHEPTLPVLLADECATNPFLRADNADVARAVGMEPGTDPALVFAELRRRKDVF